MLQPDTSIAPTSPEPQDKAGPLEPLEPPVLETSVPMDIDPTLEQPEEEEEPSFSEHNDRIQILDLHTQNPLISYQNQMYSCEWNSTLGTDILLTAPAPDFPHPVLREKPNVSVLATSSIKLMGRPAQIASRHAAEEGSQTSTPAPDTSTASANTAKPEKPPPIKIPLGPTPSRARQNQAKFLERLIAIKAKKGEKDSVTVYTQKVNQGSGWRSQRKASEGLEDRDEEHETKAQQQGQRGKATGGRPRGGRRTRGPRTAKGGLFRDYRPQLWDTPGADIRADTPESWDQLEGAGASDERQTPMITTAAASPLPADQTVNGSIRSLSPAAASPTPPFQPVGSTNGEEPGRAIPDPSLAPSLGLQPAMVRGDDAVPAIASASRVPDVEMEDVQ